MTRADALRWAIDIVLRRPPRRAPGHLHAFVLVTVELGAVCGLCGDLITDAEAEFCDDGCQLVAHVDCARPLHVEQVFNMGSHDPGDK